MNNDLQREIDDIKSKLQEAQNGYAYCCATADWTDLSKHKKNVSKYTKILSALLRQRARV